MRNFKILKLFLVSLLERPLVFFWHSLGFGHLLYNGLALADLFLPPFKEVGYLQFEQPVEAVF